MDRFILKHAICHQSPTSIDSRESELAESPIFVLILFFFRQEPDKDGREVGK